MNREGFWKTAKTDSRLPVPVASEQMWGGQMRFLAALTAMELEQEERGRVTQYRGWSTCRICGCNNGSTEFDTPSWRWPAGFRHYVEIHNVRPSLAFQEYILGQEIE